MSLFTTEPMAALYVLIHVCSSSIYIDLEGSPELQRCFPSRSASNSEVATHILAGQFKRLRKTLGNINPSPCLEKWLQVVLGSARK